MLLPRSSKIDGMSESPHLQPQFLVWDSGRQRSCQIVAASLNELIMQASGELGLPVARVCLEQDGTEVDEEEYFATLEGGTALVVLEEGERWLPLARYKARMEEARCRSSPPSADFELLSDMDPDSLTDIVPDKLFLEAVRDACNACRVPTNQTGTPREAVNSI